MGDGLPACSRAIRGETPTQTLPSFYRTLQKLNRRSSGRPPAAACCAHNHKQQPASMARSSDAPSNALASLLGGAPGALRLLLGAAAGALLGAAGAVLLLQQQAAAAGDGASAPPQQQQQQQQQQQPPQRDEELKMVLCVNTSLDMRKGKIGAQCAHAAVGIVDGFRAGNEVLFRRWDATGAPKVSLKVKDVHQMLELAEQASLAGLPWYIVEDQGRTQIAAGSRTVLAIGPAYKSDVDAITGGLLLL